MLASALQLSAQSRQYLHEGWTFGEARFPNRGNDEFPLSDNFSAIQI